MSENEKNKTQEVNLPQEGEGAVSQVDTERDADYVRKLRAEAAEYRRKLRELEAKLKADEEAKMSEQERLQKRVAELERQVIEYQEMLRRRTLEYEVKSQASKMGVVDPDAAWRLIDITTIEYDEDGRPKNLEKTLKALISARPWLLGNSAAPSPTNPPRGGLTLEDIKRMTPQEINKRWEEIKKVLAG